jgi:VanZ family protein
MKIIFISIVMLLYCSVSYAEDWNKSDKILLESFVIGQVINYSQINSGYSRNWNEINPIVDKITHQGKYLKEYKLGSTILVGLMANYIPKYRKSILILSNTLVWACVGNDIRVGVGFKF